jgi:hypothetical protein
MESGFLLQIYNWLFNYFFSGDLPAILAPISEELCAVLSLVVMAFAFAPIVMVLICLWKFLSSFCRF